MEAHDIQAIVSAVLKEMENVSAPAAEETPTATSAEGSIPKIAAPETIPSEDAPYSSVDEGSLEDLGSDAIKKFNGVDSPKNAEIVKEFIAATGARLGTGKVGPRPKTIAYLRFLADHSRSKGTVFKEVPDEWLEKTGMWSVQSMATHKDEYLTRPDLGRKITPEGVATIKEKITGSPQVQVVLSDGLSTDALLANYEEILPPLMNGLKNAGLSTGDPFFLRYGRVKAEDVIGEAIGCDVVVLLVGERPGLGQSESMSCYAVYRPTVANTVESDRTVISNIHGGGTPPVEAAAVIVDFVKQMIHHKASGIALNQASS